MSFPLCTSRRFLPSLFHYSRPFSASALRRTSHSPSIPHVPSCPSPTCACARMPPDLDIDRKSPLLHTMAPYTEQVVICTGKDDWSSRIEDEQSDSGDFLRGIKGIIGRGGQAFDPFNNILTTLSSLPASPIPPTTSALLFPSFLRISSIPNTPPSYNAFASAYLKARHLHPAHSALSPAQRKPLLRDDSLAKDLPPAIPIENLTVLICGHAARDKRCGTLGPILRSQFEKELDRRGVDAQVGLISHIGGHKYAGNVILYVPPSLTGNALAGLGIWYGRVEPASVEGIVEETVKRGRVIEELFRGGITRDGGSLGRILEEQIRIEKGEDGGLRLRPRARA
ncbi:uncharacterized protein EI97DRAFT_422724 [Westerdykella ornata]|uniref:Altered inheritance of mitochondria protein 32 n=1 Tax=Westerdykella ornata TaxID=318751 RepID=A0A6A6JD90_WESOR|nr:uncharacterized protein EI97DRAFT_422724 [Westerdykella ornata]KAF2274235.1 hypothetical protein EI97DRAFT_422724 [Westerdykella ornata]